MKSARYRNCRKSSLLFDFMSKPKPNYKSVPELRIKFCRHRKFIARLFLILES